MTVDTYAYSKAVGAVEDAKVQVIRFLGVDHPAVRTLGQLETSLINEADGFEDDDTEPRADARLRHHDFSLTQRGVA